MHRYTANTAPQNWIWPYTDNQPQWTTWQIWYTSCLKCGHQVSCMDKFCPNCGAPLWVAESMEDKVDRLLKEIADLREEVRGLSEKANDDGEQD